MKNWSNPELKELNVSNTEATYLNGTIADGGVYENQFGEIPLTSDGSLEPEY